MMAHRTVWILPVLILGSLFLPSSLVLALSPGQEAQLFASRSVYVSVEASTWMPRGRTLADIAPTIRRRLAAEGFTVMRSPAEPHDLTVQVQYREERGHEYRVDDYGTVIRCRLELVHRTAGVLWNKTLVSESGEQDAGTPPYLVALEDFQTNPYYFFLGPIVRAATAGSLDLVDILSVGLRRLAVAEAMMDDESPARAVDAGHGMLFAETIYTSLIIEKTIVELSRFQDTRVPDLFMDLLRHPDRRIRLAAVGALAPLNDLASGQALQRVGERDPDQQVRVSAISALGQRRQPAERAKPAAP